ncbi:MAG: lipopolysaccharide assembly protein LapA domain-containing protein [Actinomycetota bacterium]|nr:lipopolysaccharide assembly protein LapA domain-containing protein [Actinomycetota bacterium]
MSDDSFSAEEPREETLGGGPEVTHSGSGVAWGAVIILLGLALAIVFAVQNTEPVPIEFLWLDGEFPLALVILITVAVVVLLAELLGMVFRRRRRRRHTDRQELKKFRESS